MRSGGACDLDGQTGGFVFTGMKQLDGSAIVALKIRGDLIVDGAITGRSLAVQGLITQSAQTDNLIVGNLQVANGAVPQTVGAGSGGNTATGGVGVRGSGVLRSNAYFKGNSNSGSTNGPGQFFIQRDGVDIDNTNASFALFKPDSGNIP